MLWLQSQKPKYSGSLDACIWCEIPQLFQIGGRGDLKCATAYKSARYGPRLGSKAQKVSRRRRRRNLHRNTRNRDDQSQKPPTAHASARPTGTILEWQQICRKLSKPGNPQEIEGPERKHVWDGILDLLARFDLQLDVPNFVAELVRSHWSPS